MYQTIIEPEKLKVPERLVFEWTWGEEENQIAYEIEVDTDELYCNHINSGSLSGGGILVAQFIDTDLIDWKVSVDESGEKNVKITVAASVGGYKTAGEPRIIGVVQGPTP